MKGSSEKEEMKFIIASTQITSKLLLLHRAKAHKLFSNIQTEALGHNIHESLRIE